MPFLGVRRVQCPRLYVCDASFSNNAVLEGEEGACIRTINLMPFSAVVAAMFSQAARVRKMAGSTSKQFSQFCMRLGYNSCIISIIR